MPSLQASFARRLLFLTGLKKFFSDPEKFEANLAKVRKKGPDLPSRKFCRNYKVSETDHGGYTVFTVGPKSPSGVKDHVLYFHGGGYVLDVAWAHWGFIGRLIDALGMTITVPLYPLAPETKCSDLLPAMRGLYLKVADEHGAENITLMGDSAGGGLSLTLAQILRDENLPTPAKLVLLSPWLDATASHPAQSIIAKRDPMLAPTGLKTCANAYRGSFEVEHPWLSPLFGDLSNLPPMQMFAGTDDILLPDAQRLSEKLGDIESSLDYREYQDMFHVWMLLNLAEGKQVVDEIAGFIRTGQADFA